ncbi:hypothetical protein EP04_01780 [Listeria monocytogenes]|nr:hypothetical protein [Listeria monocytogenes]
MDGYIALHRKIIDSWIWQDPEFYRLWSYCLIKASFKERDVFIGQQIVNLKPGQFVIGREKLEAKMNIGLQKPRSALTWWRRLQKLENDKMLNIKSNNKYSIITIVNWELYQSDSASNEQQTEQQTNNRRTTDGQQMNTNNNVNKDNNVNKENNTRTNKFDEVHLQIANYFVQEIKKNIPQFRQPKIDNWANVIRLMMERDNRTQAQIEYLIKWVQQDEFEMGNVLSPIKLRKRFDALVIKAKNDYNKKNVSQNGRQQQNQDLLERMKQDEQI